MSIFLWGIGTENHLLSSQCHSDTKCHAIYIKQFFRLVYFSSGNGLLLPISACRVVVALPDPLLLIDSLLPAETAAVSVAVTEVEAVPAEVTWTSGSGGWPAFRSIRLIDETEGIEFGSQILWANNWSLISQANKLGLSDLSLNILLTTDGVATCWKSGEVN